MRVTVETFYFYTDAYWWIDAPLVELLIKVVNSISLWGFIYELNDVPNSVVYVTHWNFIACIFYSAVVLKGFKSQV